MQTVQIAPPQPRRRPVLLVFMSAHFSHHLCTSAAIPLLPMIRDTFALDYFRSGLLLSAFSLTFGFSQLPMAAMSDHFSKRRILALGLLGTGLASIGAGLSTDYFHIVLSLMLMGIAGATYHAPASAFLSQTFGKTGRGQSLGLHVVGGSSGLMAAPVLAILLANATGSWRNSFLVMGIPPLVIGVLLWTLARSQESVNIKALAQEEAEPLHLLRLLRVLGTMAIIAMLTQLLVSGINSFLPLYLVDRHGTSRDVAGLMMGVVYGAGVVGAPLGGALSDRLGRKPVILMSVVGVGPFIYLITVLPFGVVMAAAIVGYGLFSIFRVPCMESFIADVVPAQRRATVLGGYYLLTQEGIGILTPVLGWMMDRYGIQSGFTILSLVAVGSSLLVLLLRRKV